MTRSYRAKQEILNQFDHCPKLKMDRYGNYHLVINGTETSIRIKPLKQKYRVERKVCNTWRHYKAGVFSRYYTAKTHPIIQLINEI